MASQVYLCLVPSQARYQGIHDVDVGMQRVASYIIISFVEAIMAETWLITYHATLHTIETKAR